LRAAVVKPIIRSKVGDRLDEPRYHIVAEPRYARAGQRGPAATVDPRHRQCRQSPWLFQRPGPFPRLSGRHSYRPADAV